MSRPPPQKTSWFYARSAPLENLAYHSEIVLSCKNALMMCHFNRTDVLVWLFALRIPHNASLYYKLNDGTFTPTLAKVGRSPLWQECGWLGEHPELFSRVPSGKCFLTLAPSKVRAVKEDKMSRSPPKDLLVLCAQRAFRKFGLPFWNDFLVQKRTHGAPS